MNTPDDYNSYSNRCDLCGGRTHPAEPCGCEKYRCTHCEQVFDIETGETETASGYICESCNDEFKEWS